MSLRTPQMNKCDFTVYTQLYKTRQVDRETGGESNIDVAQSCSRTSLTCLQFESLKLSNVTGKALEHCLAPWHMVCMLCPESLFMYINGNREDKGDAGRRSAESRQRGGGIEGGSNSDSREGDTADRGRTGVWLRAVCFRGVLHADRKGLWMDVGR